MITPVFNKNDDLCMNCKLKKGDEYSSFYDSTSFYFFCDTCNHLVESSRLNELFFFKALPCSIFQDMEIDGQKIVNIRIGQKSQKLIFQTTKKMFPSQNVNQKLKDDIVAKMTNVTYYPENLFDEIISKF